MPAEKRKVSSKKLPDAKGKKKRDLNEETGNSDVDAHQKIQDEKNGPSAKYRSTGRRILIRLSTIAVLLVGAHLYFGQGQSVLIPLAKQTETLPAKFIYVKCSEDFEADRAKFPECAPKLCGRGVMDTIVSEKEAKQLVEVAKKGLSYGGSNGGASILDLHSGALSKGDSFINIYQYIEQKNLGNVFSSEDIRLYRKVADKIKVAISARFQIPGQKIYLTHPTFFSRMNSKKAKTLHDEYWHPHVDKKTYETFDYTSLLYLTDYDVDFKGGRFVFIDDKANSTVEPKLGRLSFFTSGSENTHFVEKVTSGTRYAITVSFTCDKKHAIQYPKMGS
ncbi:2-oxoglutarate and iron-dependent oxygenase domain-containing protein 3-like [Strongylocentrotus purpuratus]|uniref:Fe2OG dioxygenase domain-containing protein n=1 Tax=Strongylocentrotus purpuratus TaxID=7668 RepID=A0A7M7NR53_STRPU|nr:2-oxoglutarate and iron-dependent oxygenase domain-containing protein 3-like [Strongylocentrotus purpuratus]|eukprot:XP_011675477.1 PREDICTED: 2-oxoglutarate and iron-dependent oxygenase domain-containing protein 3-like [Strongylocentrotus purpuratus]